MSDPVGGISRTLNSGVWVSGAPSGPTPSGGFVSIDVGSDVSLVLTGEPGVAYNEDWASNIWDESWTYSGLSVTGSSNPVQVVDSDAQWNGKYYRLSLKPPEAIPGAFNHDFREGTLDGWTDTEDAFIATQDNQGLLPWKGDYHLWAHGILRVFGHRHRDGIAQVSCLYHSRIGQDDVLRGGMGRVRRKSDRQ